MGTDGLDRVGQQFGVAGAKLHLHRFADRRAGFRLAGLDIDAGEAGCPRADIGQDLVGRAPLFPLVELDGDLADDVLGDILPVAGAAGARVHRREFARQSQHLNLDLAHQGVFLEDRQIAARMHHDDGLLGFDVGEEFQSFAVDREIDPGADHGDGSQHENFRRVPQGHRQHLQIGAGEPAHRVESAVLAARQCPHPSALGVVGVFVKTLFQRRKHGRRECGERRRPGRYARAERRHENQRHQQRCR